MRGDCSLHFRPGGSDYDLGKMFDTLTVLDINYRLAKAKYFSLNLPSQ